MVSPSADRLAVEKFARYFIRAFRDILAGKEGPMQNAAEITAKIKANVGPEIQTLTSENVFRVPSTFSFILRSLASIEGIGKELTPDTWDITKSAQPFVKALIDEQRGVQE